MRWSLLAVMMFLGMGCDSPKETKPTAPSKAKDASPPTPSPRPTPKKEEAKSPFDAAWEEAIALADKEDRIEPDKTKELLARLAPDERKQVEALMGDVDRDGLASPAVLHLNTKGFLDWTHSRCVKSSRADQRFKAVVRVLSTYWKRETMGNQLYVMMGVWPALDPIEHEAIFSAVVNGSRLALTSANTRRQITTLGGAGWLNH